MNPDAEFVEVEDDGANTFVVGTRMSKLALAQTNHVVADLQQQHPNAKFKLVEQDTLGDRVTDRPLPEVGGKGLFTEELEDGLRSNEIDFAVHSLKDLPTRLPENLTLGCITERCDPSDVLLIRSDLVKLGFRTLADLNDSDNPDHWNIGTSSLRRLAQINHMFPFKHRLNIIGIRGNLDSRIAKLEAHAKNEGQESVQHEGQSYAATILAYAGLERQGHEYLDRITSTFDQNDMLYSVGQGSLGIECRAGDDRVLNLLKPLQHHSSYVRCTAERAFLELLEGGCHAPIAVRSEYDPDTKIVQLVGRVLSIDGRSVLEYRSESDEEYAEEMGYHVARELLHHGAAEIIAGTSKSSE